MQLFPATEAHIRLMERTFTRAKVMKIRHNVKIDQSHHNVPVSEEFMLLSMELQGISQPTSHSFSNIRIMCTLLLQSLNVPSTTGFFSNQGYLELTPSNSTGKNSTMSNIGTHAPQYEEMGVCRKQDLSVPMTFHAEPNSISYSLNPHQRDTAAVVPSKCKLKLISRRLSRQPRGQKPLECQCTRGGKLTAPGLSSI